MRKDMTERRILPVLVLLALALVFALGASTVATADTADVPAPVDLSLSEPDSSVGGVVEVSWSYPDIERISAFRVYRGESGTSRMKLVKERPLTGGVEGSRFEWVDVGLEPGEYYRYAVSAVSPDGREGPRSKVSGIEAPQPTGGKQAAVAGKRIIISIADQTIYFLENEFLVKKHLCSTGVDAYPTPTGRFSILYHSYLLISEQYGNAYCYWWMGFYTDTGMHALPYNPGSGTWTGANSLGSKASHGCVRQAVSDAEWAYKWAPDGTRLDVIPGSYEEPPPPPPPITGGHDTIGVNEPGNEWYFAEGYTGGEFDTYLLIQNPNAQNANIGVQYMMPDGSEVQYGYLVDPMSRFTIHLNDIVELQDAEVSTRITSDVPVIAERAMYFDYQERLGGHDSIGAKEPSQQWYLAEGYTGGAFDEYILLQNPNEEEAVCDITYMKPDGSTLEEAYLLEAHSRKSVHVDEVPELEAAEVSAQVECNRPIVVERAMYFDYDEKVGGHATIGVTEPSREWYLAEGYTGGSFDEYVLVQNPTEEAGMAAVTFMTGEGGTYEFHYDVDAHSRFTIHVDDIEELSSAEVSTMIESTVPVVVERSMYFDADGRQGGHCTIGVTGGANDWFLAEGYTGGSFDEYILIQNPTEQAGQIGIKYMLSDGRNLDQYYQLEPYSRYTVHVDNVEGLSNAEVSASVSSQLFPVICERAMYFEIPRVREE